MDTNILVSIIIPNYNGESFLSETINSVLSQTYIHYEVIIVDDGSTDNSKQIIEGYQNNKLKIIFRPDNYPKGANSCRNIGINNSKGKYLIFLDSDDILDKNCLKNRVEYMETHHNIDFAVFNMRKFNNDIHDGVVFTRLSHNDPILHFIGTDSLWQTTAVMWRAEFVKKIGGYNLSYQRLQDPEMTLRALFNSSGNYKLVANSIPDSYFRSNPNNSNLKLKKQYHALFQFIEEFYIPNNKRYLNSINTFYIFYSLSIFHFIYCCSYEDKQKYKESVRRICKYNNRLSKNILYIISHTILPFLLFKHFSFIRRCAFYYRYRYKKNIYNQI